MLKGEITVTDPRFTVPIFETDFYTKSKIVRDTLRDYQQLTDLLPFNYSLGSGPTYSARSSGQIESEVKTFFLQSPARVLRYSLLAFDQSGEILGYRLSGLASWKRGFKSEGVIFTRSRVKGVSTVIESAHLDLLQRFANQYIKLPGGKLIWELMKANEIFLHALRQQYNKTQDPEILQELERKYLEVRRWRAQYGPGGKFGFDERGIREIFPQTSPQTGLTEKADIGTISNIHLERNFTGIYEPVEIERIDPEVAISLRERNLLFFREFINTDSGSSQAPEAPM